MVDHYRFVSDGKRANRRHKNVNLHFGAAAEKRKSKQSPGKVVSTRSAKGKRYGKK